jgi:hypothetical protein
MGMDQKVICAPERVPSWPRLAQFAAEHGIALKVMMIDGELAFPDEVPGEQWRELRVSAAGGMVTLRREPDGVALVKWGNADAGLRQAWNTLAWALAHLSGGTVKTHEGQHSAADFALRASLPRSITDEES